MKTNVNRNTTLGYGLMAASTALWIAIAVLPFTALSAGTATVIGGVLLFVGEGLFAAGVAMAGPQLLTALKNFFARQAAPVQVPVCASGQFPRMR